MFELFTKIYNETEGSVLLIAVKAACRPGESDSREFRFNLKIETETISSDDEVFVIAQDANAILRLKR
jgi:hypothetical protein